MKNQVVDASTLLAYLQGESGSDMAGRYCNGALISAVNLAEVFQKSIERGNLAIAKAIVHQSNIEVVPFNDQQASIVAELHLITKGKNISFADRACLALGRFTSLPVVTGDTGWRDLDVGVKLVYFRSPTK